VNEALKLVRETELELCAQVEAAQQRVSEMIRRKTAEATKEAEAAKEEARKEVESVMAARIKDAEKKIATMKQSVEEENKVFGQKAQKHMDKAVSFIVERIVTARGGR